MSEPVPERSPAAPPASAKPTELSVLHVEEKPEDVARVVEALERGGLAPRPRQVHTSDELALALSERDWDVVLCAYTLGSLTAEQALAQVLATGSDAPFIVVSGAIGEATAVALLKAGATDYVMKSDLGRLAPAIERALRDASERSARRLADQAVRENEARLRALVTTALDAVIVIREDGTVEEFSPVAERLFGFRANEVVGHNVNVLIPAPWNTEHDLYLARYLERGVARIVGTRREVTGKRKDGSVFPAELAVSEFVAGGRRWFLGMMRDLSEHRRLEEQFFQAQKMEAIGRLAGGIAHDFNNLLTAIVTCAHLAVEEIPPDSPAREDLDRISQAAERGSALTRQLLAFSRKQPGEVRVVSLPSLTERLVGLLGRLLGEDIRVVVTPAPGVGRVVADPGQLEQVMVNLAVNARDAMPSGGTLTITMEDVDIDAAKAGAWAGVEPGPAVQVSVTDTGTGMAPEVMARLFEPFFTTKSAGRGTGLGLATCYGIVKQLRGHIWAESQLGGGTTFRIVLPRSAEEDTPLPTTATSTRPHGGETVLVVEDDVLVRDVMVQVLRNHGYAVIAATDGPQAMEVMSLTQRRVELLVTDVVMPEVNGPDLARALRRLHPGLRVLLVTGYTDDAVLRSIAEDGFDLLRKPFTPLELTSRVRAILDRPPPRA
ncbi:MAG: response regulator [Deltaproteobacteria bacterium]|jgi:PAS domain S-box-containing protein|nr:response regulator [Deltaproteobacteria bacterium]